MTSTRKIHQQKLARSAAWLVRWGICDRESLIFASQAQLENWPQKCVDAGIAKRVPCPAACGFTNLHLFVPTPLAHQLAASLGVDLPALGVREYNRCARHRILVQRLLQYVVSKRGRGYELDWSRIVTEREMKFLAQHENTLRIPDAFFTLENEASDVSVRYALETETEGKSETRLEAMQAGIAEILECTKANLFSADAVVFAIASDVTRKKYKSAFKEGATFERHGKKEDEKGVQRIVPIGGKKKMPGGCSFVAINEDGRIQKDSS